jgi:lysophospholipase L1-like esterase
MSAPILFIGDSVTDCNRESYDSSDRSLGDGFVRNINASNRISHEVINRGISGNRIGDLENRWQQDVLNLKPKVLSILIGVNDTWRRFDDNDPTSAEDFIARYKVLLQQTLSELEVDLYLCQPFILPVREEMSGWLEDLDEKIVGIKSLAQEFGATYIPFGDKLNTEAQTLGMSALAEDGIHPTILGHEIMAQFWLDHYRG